MMRTSLSLIKGWNVPIALLPPPTQAMTAVGSLPVRPYSCVLISVPMTLWKSRTMVGNGAGPIADPTR